MKTFKQFLEEARSEAHTRYKGEMSQSRHAEWMKPHPVTGLTRAGLAPAEAYTDEPSSSNPLGPQDDDDEIPTRQRQPEPTPDMLLPTQRSNKYNPTATKFGEFHKAPASMDPDVQKLLTQKEFDEDVEKFGQITAESNSHIKDEDQLEIMNRHKLVVAGKMWRGEKRDKISGGRTRARYLNPSSDVAGGNKSEQMIELLARNFHELEYRHMGEKHTRKPRGSDAVILPSHDERLIPSFDTLSPAQQTRHVEHAVLALELVSSK